LGRGLALAALNRVHEAAQSYDRSIALQPNAEAYKYGGDLCCRLNRFEQAAIFYDNAIRLKPDYAMAHCMRANALQVLGRSDDARASFDKAIELDPGLRHSLGRLLYLQSLDCLVELDFPVAPAARWNENAPHPQLAKIVGAGDARYASTVDSFMRYARQLLAIQHTPSNPTAPHWGNPWLPPMDAASLYSFLASRNPRRYVEIGSGNSTKFARQAIADHQLRTQIISIDPVPRSEIDSICDRILRSRLEYIDLSVFDDLTGDDVIFCDNSHRSLQNSDVTVFFVEVLPRLKGGPLVGVHDIFLPYDYPSTWFARFYNEQYLLACWLLANDRVQIELPACHVASTPALKERFAPVLSESMFTGLESSFWFTLV
jgi:hypothetical protein